MQVLDVRRRGLQQGGNLQTERFMLQDRHQHVKANKIRFMYHFVCFEKQSAAIHALISWQF